MVTRLMQAGHAHTSASGLKKGKTCTFQGEVDLGFKSCLLTILGSCNVQSDEIVIGAYGCRIIMNKEISKAGKNKV